MQSQYVCRLMIGRVTCPSAAEWVWMMNEWWMTGVTITHTRRDSSTHQNNTHVKSWMKDSLPWRLRVTGMWVHIITWWKCHLSCISVTLAAMEAAVMCEEELSSVEATPLSFFSSSSSSHCTPLSSVCRWGLLVGGGDRGGGGEGRSSSSLGTSFTLTTASRRRSMAWGRAGRMNWKHSCTREKQNKNIKS